MKKRDLFKLLDNINELSNTKYSVRFSYALAKNKKLIEGESSILRETISEFKSPEKFQEYEEKRMELCKKMAEKDSDGEPIIKNGGYVIVDMEDFEKKLSSLKKKYSDALELNAKIQEELNSLLDEEVDISQFTKVSLNLFPETITPKQMEALFIFVSEDDA